MLGGTRERILRIAESIFGESGYHGARLHNIARHVGIRKASLFHYFPSKEDLYRAVLEEGVGDAEAMIRKALEVPGRPLDKIRELVEAYVDMVAVHPARTRILLRQSLGDAPTGQWPPESQRLFRLVADFVAEGQKAGLLAPMDPSALVTGVVAMVAFFFTSAPVLAPTWFSEPWDAASVERVKRHVVDVVERCLTVGAAARPAVSESVIG